MIVRAREGWYVVGAKGWKAGPYATAEEATRALLGGAAESCSDGGCGDGRTG